jgi:hypothetical protein
LKEAQLTAKGLATIQQPLNPDVSEEKQNQEKKAANRSKWPAIFSHFLHRPSGSNE